MSDIQARPYWPSMTSYLLVTTGAIVGLGNIIQFPYYIYKFGGLFFLLYVLCELFICIPLLFAELLTGRRGKQNPVGSFSMLAMETGVSRKWRFIGWLCFIIVFFTLANYIVSVSFPAVYFVDSVSVLVKKPITHTSILLELCLLVFLFITMLVILRGISHGLKTISCITVPLYSAILLGLAIYSCTSGNFMFAIGHLFNLKPDASFNVVFMAALAYAFFKLNVGMGSMIVYGSYLPYFVPIGRSTVMIVIFDAIISLLAYFVICPLFNPQAATVITGMVSYQQTLSFFFQKNHGSLIALCFFFATIIAAWTPTIAMAETAVIILIERFAISRRTATLLIFAGAALLGTAVILCYDTFGNVLVFHQWKVTRFIDGITATFLIPISALLTAIFIGWVVKRTITASELRFNPVIYGLWRFLIRWVAPVFIVLTMGMLWWNY